MTSYSQTAAVVVLDIEGTTSAAGFVLGELYDYARPRLGPWLEANGDDPDVAKAAAQIRELAGLPPTAGTAELVKALHSWMDNDQKVTPLKTLQGQIWERGFADGELASHFFDDVAPAIRRWHEAGVGLAVFSSGSVRSQVPWFRHSSAGDLTGLISGYFDTVNAGPKRAADSYRKIAAQLAAEPPQLLFLTDLPAELDAAAAAGWQVIGVIRPGEPNAEADFGAHRTVTTFAELDVIPATSTPATS